MKRTIRFALFSAMLCLALYQVGCRIMIAPSEERPVRVFRAQPLVPEGWYEDVHAKVEKCAGKSRPYATVEWFMVNAGSMGDWVGLFSPPHRIYLDERRVLDASIVGHELLHYVTELGDDEDDFQALLSICGFSRE